MKRGIVKLYVYLKSAQNLVSPHFNISREGTPELPPLAEEPLLVSGCWRRGHFSSDI